MLAIAITIAVAALTYATRTKDRPLAPRRETARHEVLIHCADCGRSVMCRRGLCRQCGSEWIVPVGKLPPESNVSELARRVASNREAAADAVARHLVKRRQHIRVVS